MEVVAAVVAVVSWFIVTINMIRVAFHIKEGVVICGRKTNVMFRPHQLTERGLAIRRQFFLALIGLVASVATIYACDWTR